MKSTIHHQFIFLLAVALLASCIPMATLAQPMSGSFTVGGVLPDFPTLQDAAVALKTRGVSGPVFCNIRPGTYMEDGGNSTVLLLDTLVNGVSPTNRITFQPDADAGGNVDNVVLRFNRTDPPTADRNLVFVKLDYVTLRDLTLDDIDSSHTFDNHLIRLEGRPIENPVVDGFTLEGCKLIGSPFRNAPGFPLGTDFGIGSIQDVSDLTVRGNTFAGLLRAVSVDNGGALAGPITVEDNHITEGYSSMSGTGNRLGSGIQVSSTVAIVRRNVVDFTESFNGGNEGIHVVVGPATSRIEQNLVIGTSSIGMFVTDFGFSTADSVFVANNMIAGGIISPRIGLKCEATNARVVFNTIALPPVIATTTGLRVTGNNCTVLNNIVVDNASPGGGFVVAYDLGGASQTLNLRSDYNIIYKDAAANGAAVIFEAVPYPGLSSFQEATGLDTNSLTKAMEFVDLFSDLHLSDCQVQDPDLAGIPVSGVTTDYDGGTRNTISPTIGADEAVGSAHDLFGDSFKILNEGAAFSVDAGLYNNIIANSLVIPDWDNNLVRVFDYLDPREYVLDQDWPTNECEPTVVKIADMDQDFFVDIVVACSGTPLLVYYMDGGFSSQVSSIGGTNTRSIEIADVNMDGLPDIIATQGDPIAYVNDGGRGNFVPHTLDNASTTTGDLVVRDLDGDSDLDVLVMNESPVFTTISINLNLGVSGGDWDGFGGETEYQYLTGAHTDAASIADGDFDGDGDIDFIFTHSTGDSLVFLLNNGNATFVRQTILDQNHRAVAALDYEDDGDVDLAVAHLSLALDGFSIFFNDGNGNFQKKQNCFVSSLVNGVPTGMLGSHLDFDNLPDLIITTVDSVFVLFNLGGGPAGINPPGQVEIPQSFSLSQNYPNPFNPATAIRYQLPTVSFVELRVFDILGRELTTLVSEEQAAGEYAVQWDGTNAVGSDVSSGVYFYRLEARDLRNKEAFVSVRKMLMVK